LAIGGGNFATRQVTRLLDWLAIAYRKRLQQCLRSTRSRAVVLLGAFAIFGASLFLVKGLRTEFLPPQDQSHFLVTLYTKMGSSLTSTDAVFKEAEKLYQQWKNDGIVDHYYISVGGFGAGGLVNQGMSYVTMKPVNERRLVTPFNRHAPTQQEFMEVLRGQLEKIPGVERVALMDLSLNGFSSDGGYPIQFVLQGPDWHKLADLSVEMRKRLKDSKLMADLDTDYNPNMPETEIYPDREKAAQRLVPITEIAQEISALVGGLKLTPNKYTDASGHRDDIQVKLVAGDNRGEADINNIGVRNTQGEITSLGSLINIKTASTLLTVTRYNRERGIQIFGNFSPGRSQSEVMDYIRKMAKDLLPPGYHVKMSGSSEAFSDSTQSLLVALLLGIFISYMVLASQFNSFLHPSIILLALPFSLSGAFLAMRLTDTSINVYSLIGILLLMGIVKKNSILLVEFTNHKRTEGLGVADALLGACPVRLRPILMTSLATVAGALPAAFIGGVGSEVTRPMAITVIGGVTVSTLFTLLVVPCAYALTARFESKKYDTELKKALRMMGKRNAEPCQSDFLIPPSGNGFAETHARSETVN
jgi:HAE1 family hydrophobic/amphiphilic exporter-1